MNRLSPDREKQRQAPDSKNFMHVCEGLVSFMPDISEREVSAGFSLDKKAQKYIITTAEKMNLFLTAWIQKWFD